MIIGLDHAGYRVENLEESITHYENLGFKILKRFEIENENIKAAMLRKGEQGIELFECPNPTAEISKKVSHHIALRSDDVDADVQKFLNDGWKISMPISTGRVVKKYAYVEDKLGNQIEIVELTKTV